MRDLERAAAYGPGHCWYYFLDGRVRYPRDILEDALARGYEGYARKDILAADAKAEPCRSQELRTLRARFLADMRADLSRYREVALKLHRRRKSGEEPETADDLHVSLSLKYCHLFNDFGHLALIDRLLSRQPDLFD